MKIKLILLIALVLLLSVFTTVSAEGEIAKQIVIGRPSDSTDLDPVTQDGNPDIWMFNLVLEGLVKSSDDGSAIEPCLADSWDISEDGLTYTFHLKKGVKFSDGSPVTGEDWVWTLKRARDTEGSTWSFAIEALEDVTAPDDNTIILKVKEPRANFLVNLAMFNLTVQKKAYYEKVGQEAYSQKPLGTGPYLIKEWKRGEYLLFKKNPYYRIEGLPKTEEIKFTVVADDNTRTLQLESGQIDVATYVPFNKMKTLNGNPKLVVVGLPSTRTTYLILNNTKKPIDNPKVRLALEYGTDKQEMVNFILFGYGEAAPSYAPKSGLFFNYDLKDRGYDVDKAKALLTEAGYPDGFETELLVRSGNAVYQKAAVILKEQWAKIGITVNILTLESGLTTNKYYGMDYKVTLAQWTNDTSDPSQQCGYVFIPEASNCFHTGWRSDRAIDLVKQGELELDITKRKQIYLELQQIFYDEIPMLPLFYSPYPVAMSKNIEGFVQTPLGTYRFENTVKYVK